MSLPGTLLFAQYAHPPNELGYCGPNGAAALLDPAAGFPFDLVDQLGPAEIARRARQFEGVWSYLEVIAEAPAGRVTPRTVKVLM